jgi:hypothetical protein
MPTAVESIDFKQLKAALAGSDPENPSNCAVGTFADGSVSLVVDRRKSGKTLVRGLEGPKPSRLYWGTAFYDKFPGALNLSLNRRAPSALAPKLKSALRGSGFGKVVITFDEGSEDESEE